MSNDELIGTAAVAALLGVTEDEVHVCVRRTRGLRPRLVGGRRIWSRSDVEKLRAALAERSAQRADGAARP